MRKAVDLIGKRFNSLVVVERAGSYIRKDGIKGYAIWLCACDCGNTAKYAGSALMGGKIHSCGCENHKKSTKHGMYKTRVYRIWHGIINRCLNVNTTGYSYYGGRGIKVCDSWRSFVNFYADMGDPPSDLHTIDRIDCDGNYEKSNCRWATMSAQQQNKRVYRNWNAKLDEESVRQIRASDEPRLVVAKRFGVSERYITSIRMRKTWKHV